MPQRWLGEGGIALDTICVRIVFCSTFHQYPALEVLFPVQFRRLVSKLWCTFNCTMEDQTTGTAAALIQPPSFVYLFLFLTVAVPLLGLGGIHAIGALVAIKFKLVLIFLAVMGTVFYGYKIYAGSSCPSIISEHPSITPFEGYSSSFPGIYSSADPYSGYSDHGPGSAIGAEVAPSGSAGPYRRTSTSQKRSSDDSSSTSRSVAPFNWQLKMFLIPLLNSFDFSELAFTVLGVESKECRKRFICEMTVNYNRNPILGSAYMMISRQFFPLYAKEISKKAPKSLKDCARMYSECRGPSEPTETNALEESSTVVGEEEEEEARAAPKLDQVQRFVVGSVKDQ